VLTNGHGDAAFADYVWLASYSYRFSRHPMANHQGHDTPDHVTSQPAPADPAAGHTAGAGAAH